MKYLSALWLAFVILCCSVTTEGCARPAKAPDAEDMDSEVVALVGVGKDHEFHVFCGATWVSDERLLTAAHCAMAWAEIQAETDIEQHPAFSTYREAFDSEKSITRAHGVEVEAVDEAADLALLRATDAPRHKSASVAMSGPSVGDQIYIVGHPGGDLPWTHIQGNVAALRYMTGPEQDDGVQIEGAFIQVSAPVYYGNSGGPCFNASGDLVGVSSFLRTDVPLAGFYVDTHTIQRFLLHAAL